MHLQPPSRRSLAGPMGQYRPDPFQSGLLQSGGPSMPPHSDVHLFALAPKSSLFRLCQWPWYRRARLCQAPAPLVIGHCALNILAIGLKCPSAQSQRKAERKLAGSRASSAPPVPNSRDNPAQLRYPLLVRDSEKLPSTMRAAVYHGANQLRVETLPIPAIGPDELLVKVAACGVCPTDIKKIQYGTVAPPRVFGHEPAGTTVRVG